jgi:protein-tyrosine phosphatase
MGRGRGKRRKARKARKEKAMSHSKDKWTDPIGSYDGLVWDRALGAYVPKGKRIADPPRSRYKTGVTTSDERSWEAYGRARCFSCDAVLIEGVKVCENCGQDLDGPVPENPVSGDRMDDHEAINRAAAKSVTRGFMRDKLALNLCPKCNSRDLKRSFDSRGDVIATCQSCKAGFFDDDFGTESRPSMSDFAAGRYESKGSQGNLFGGWNKPWEGKFNQGWGDWVSRSGSIGFRPREKRTSKSHPLKVDFLPAEVHGRSGRLGMTFAPGKTHSGVSADHERDLDEDIKTLCQLGVNTLICLIEDHEFDVLKVPDLLEKVRDAGIDTLWHPIQDFGVPHDIEPLLNLLNAIIDDVEAGKTVVVHCKGGLGRTGTVVASVLVALGWEPEAAIAHTREARKGAVENKTQENYVAWIDTCFE